MYKPTNLDPAKKYPIVNHIYPGAADRQRRRPHASRAARGDAQALAELGFIVVEIDGMGTPWRSKKFHEAYFGDMGDNTLPDQVAGMKELAATLSVDRHRSRRHLRALGRRLRDRPTRCSAIPTSSRSASRRRATTTTACTRTTGPRSGRACCETKPDGTTNYDSQANQNFAKNLKGKLLLAHGTMDNNVPPNNTLLVVDELIKANKDFDLLMLPNRGHGFGNESDYMMRRRWDYLRAQPARRGAAAQLRAAAAGATDPVAGAAALMRLHDRRGSAREGGRARARGGLRRIKTAYRRS